MFKIILLDDYYYANETADVTFYLDVNGQAFPDEHWTDFAIVVLHWWITAIITNYFKETTEFILQLMDGPYYVKCTKHGPNVHIDCIEDKKRIRTICEGDFVFTEIVQEVIRISSQIIEAVRVHGFGELSSLDHLEQSLKQLQSIQSE